MCLSSWAVVIEYHRVSGLNSLRSLCSQNSGGCKSIDRVPGLVSGKALHPPAPHGFVLCVFLAGGRYIYIYMQITASPPHKTFPPAQGERERHQDISGSFPL